MKLTAFLLSTCLLLVAACSDDKPATQAAAPAAQPSAPAAVAPAAAPAASVPQQMPMDAGGDDEELVYDPIDAAKLDNQWWKQYSASGG